MSVGSLLREGTLPGTSGYRRAIRVGIGDHDPRNGWSRCAGIGDQDRAEGAITIGWNERSGCVGTRIWDPAASQAFVRAVGREPPRPRISGRAGRLAHRGRAAFEAHSSAGGMF